MLLRLLAKNRQTLLRLMSLAGSGIIIWAGSALLVPGAVSALPAWFPSRCTLAGLFLAAGGLLFAAGYRRRPFYLNLVLAAALSLLALLPAGASVLRGLLNDGLLLLGSGAFFLLSAWCLAVPQLNLKTFTLRLPALVLAAVAGFSLLLPAGADLDWSGDIDPAGRVLARLDPAYRAVQGAEENLRAYIEEALGDGNAGPEQERLLVDQLNRRIAVMEEELERFRAVEQENEAYRDQLEALRKKVGEINSRRETNVQISKVKTIAEAVRSTSPIVRDFAVRLASASPGTYSRSSNGSPSPGKEGIGQIFAIHRYIASRWKYVTDPLSSATDYFSPADRTIALGLAGDCDDFAILLAACIEAVGGRARILHGSCSGGAHAWCEAWIGDRSAWSDAMQAAQRLYPGRTMEYLAPSAPDDYWLCLDWQAGVYSCGGSPGYLYETSY